MPSESGRPTFASSTSVIRASRCSRPSRFADDGSGRVTFEANVGERTVVSNAYFEFA